MRAQKVKRGIWWKSGAKTYICPCAMMWVYHFCLGPKLGSKHPRLVLGHGSKGSFCLTEVCAYNSILEPDSNHCDHRAYTQWWEISTKPKVLDTKQRGLPGSSGGGLSLQRWNTYWLHAEQNRLPVPQMSWWLSSYKGNGCYTGQEELRKSDSNHPVSPVGCHAVRPPAAPCGRVWRM